MRCYLSIWFICSSLVSVFGKEKPKGFIADTLIPVLDRYCFDCHDPENSEGGVLFLEAKTPANLEDSRGGWRSVTEQLRNRIMPPAKQKDQPTENERLAIANWIKTYLRESASESPPLATPAIARRLNWLEYDNTVRDLLGIMLSFSETFPMESGGGEGLGNNGETLFTPPMLMGRFLKASGQIVDAAIVRPMLPRRYDAKDLKPAKKSPKLVESSQFALYPLKAGEEVFITLPIFTRGKYQFKVWHGTGQGQIHETEGQSGRCSGGKPRIEIRPRL
jgi:hypothetical protein